ncbi:helix-turn-helix domain-containing protein [Flavobacterium aquatile]|uniref:Helicase n=1 Tax=Flavobacterium aquatile LMG 4008 = ATCC 11947 TaxID=1453498 RepID=A0A095U2C1_9FLAO|nr:helix-turn-helix domain-containing protein [Flavobacterium aquatile]KGD68738.1 helicase [Flavobacterium aquatile LMG 4008 = ATCC 11947]OXA69157.1 helicase [Flavobacterium aquatile] [Flavobacterium aquatile LMG 4008 = ATCC 11947]GEC79090.1 helicase [Flavobacterium aquatile]
MEFISAEAKYVLQFINQTNRSVFLTGKAGTGKTTLLKEIIQTTHKNCVVVAPTGIAALNAGGVTIHSMFQLPFGGFIPDNNVDVQFTDSVKFESKDTLRRHFRMSALKKAVIQNMELLIIDEVSMLRSDLLDAIEFMLQSVRKKKLPFGGVQVLFIGDLLQLPPVIRDEEWRTLRKYYKGKFFFHSHAILQNPPLYIELSKIFRQTDESFIDILNNLRNNKITQSNVTFLNQFVKPNFDLKENKGYITLTTHNNKADTINVQSLADLEGNSRRYKARIVDDFPDKIFPLEEYLELKIGAQVMFIKNDLSFDKNYFNGKMGVIHSLSDDEIRVHFPEENKTIEVERYEWQNIRYFVNPMTKEIEEEVLGTFTHYPVKLAWAITVHKSQGLTFDKAALDVSQVFLPGQAYVALSRLRSLNGLILLSPLQMNGISNDDDVMEYANNKASTEILHNYLQQDTKNYIHNYLRNSFNWLELAQEWCNHKFSYLDSDTSAKSKHSNWAAKQMDFCENLIDPASKFMSQLDKLFRDETVDFNFINERIQAAYNYFYDKLDTLVYEILYKIEEVKRIKLVKQFYEELLVLEDLQVNAILRLMKAKKLIEIVIDDKTISKQNLNSDEIKSYKTRKIERVFEDYKRNNASLIEDKENLSLYEPKKKKSEKTPKKPTAQITYELWVEKNSIAEIATIRKLTEATILTHFTKLIQDKAVTINEILPEDKIEELQKLFYGYKEESLTPLKEQVGDAFSWEELRMFKASLNV